MEQIPTWLLALMITGLATCGSAVIASYIMLIQRITKIETIIAIWNIKFAEILHSPHTPELDALLEKLVQSYKDRYYDLTDSEWQKLHDMTFELENDQTLAKGERLLAAMINATCKHKLTRSLK